MKLRVKTYKDGYKHHRLDLEIQDPSDIDRVMNEIETFLIEEYDGIYEEGEEDDSSDDES